MRPTRTPVAVLVGALVVAGLAACTSSGDGASTASATPPLKLTSADLADVTTVIKDRNLTRPVDVDGSLRLEPSAAAAKITETQALTRWSHLQRTGSGNIKAIAIVHATASTDLTVATPDRSSKPAFKNVPSWAVISYDALTVQGCPSFTRTTPAPSATRQPPTRDITLVADDGTGRIVSYETRGSTPCFPYKADEPTATIATTPMSIPWTYKSTGTPSTKRSHIVYDVISYALPPCSTTNSAGDSPEGARVEASVSEVGPAADCAPAAPETLTFDRRSNAALRVPGPTGPTVSLYTWPTIHDGTTKPPTPPTAP